MIPVEDLPDEDFVNLTPLREDGSLEYIYLRDSKPQIGGPWVKEFPYIFANGLDVERASVLRCILIGRQTMWKQEVSACSVPELTDGENIYAVTESKTTRHREWWRRLTGSGDPYALYSTLDWENVKTTSGTIHQLYTDWDTTDPPPECTIDESAPDPPEHWDEGYPAISGYDWYYVDLTTDLEDVSTISNAAMMSAALGSLVEKVFSKSILKQFNRRSSLDGTLRLSFLSSTSVEVSTTAALIWEINIHAVGHRIPFVIRWTERIDHLGDDTHEVGELISENEMELAFNNAEGWQHDLIPAYQEGCKTNLVDLRVCPVA